MKKLIILTILLISFVVIAENRTINAQNSQRLTSTPKAFQTFYANFRNAVIKGDKETIASMTQFPFEYGWDAGDEGTYTKVEFMGKFEDIFGGTVNLFKQKNPTFYVEKGTYDLINEEDASHYIFKESRGVYRFTALAVEA